MSVPSQHPISSGTLVGCIEICFTFPFEYVKRQLQLQQQSSALARAATVRFTGPVHCTVHTVRMHGVRGLYVGFPPFFVFAGPRSAIRFYAFEALSALLVGQGAASLSGRQRAAADTACGFGAGLCEAALGQTPNQAISTKMLHDASPSGQRRLRGLGHAVRTIYAEHGFWRGFFCGLEPALIKGATTNCIRFPVFGGLKQWLQQRGEAAGGGAARPLRPSEALLAGAVAGGVSAVATQPIDTVMAQAQGLESARFRNSLQCAREIVAAGGVRALYFGLGPRVVRVMLEVGLQFSLYESIAPWVDRVLARS